MTTPDTPAERGRDELRERATKLAQGYLNYPQSVMLRDAIVALFDDLLAPQEAPQTHEVAPGSPSMAPDGSEVGSGLRRDCGAVAAPQEAREPEAIERPCGCEDDGRLRFTAREWLRAWHKAGVRELLGAPAPAEATEREPELLGYVVERQLTTGEWMRVWRGSTMWVDHDEAVLDRDAYALDGIPARIRPVYLGAPTARGAPEEGAGE